MVLACVVDIRRSFLLLLFVVNHQKVLSKLTIKPLDSESVVNESTYFNCSSTITDKEIQWDHYPMGAEAHEGKSVYANGKFYEDYEIDFILERNNSSGTNNIVITSVKPYYAGRYVCKDDVGDGQSSSAQLIVLENEPVCNSDMNPAGAIGPNPCGIQPGELHLSCSVAYHGNVPPELRWNRLGMNYSMIKNVTKVLSGNQVTFDLTVRTDLLDSNSSFECQITRSRTSRHSCTTPTLKLLYIYSASMVTVRSTGEVVNCSANTSSSSCEYNWKWYNKNDILTVFYHRILKVENEGMHHCEATCNFQDKKCTVSAFVINATQNSTAAVPGDSSAAVAICVTILVVFLVTLVLLVAFIMCRRKYGLKVPFRGSRRTLEAEGTGVESTAPLLFVVPMENVSPSVESGRIPGSTANNPIIISDDEQAMDGNTSPGEEQPGKRKKIEEPKNEEIAFALYPELLHVQSLEDQNDEQQSVISGLVVLDKELFVAFDNKSEVKVFQAITFEPLRSITVTDLDNPLDVVSMDHSLYISSPKKIYKVVARYNDIFVWPIEDGGGTLSVTRDQTVILSDWKRTSLREYSADLKLISEVRLPSDVHPFHAVKTRDDQFVVSYEDRMVHKVAKFHVNGTIIQTFSEMLRFPKYLAINSDGHIFVVDQKNSRVLTMSPTLKSSKVLLSDKDNLVRPVRIYLDEKNSRMFVVDIKTGGQKFMVFRLSKHKPGVNEEAAATKDRPHHVGSNHNLKDSGGIEHNSEVVSIDSDNEEEEDGFIEAKENLDVTKENLDETENLDEEKNLDETEHLDESRGKKRKR